MKVIKIGGSLIADIDVLTDCINTLAKITHEKIVIVPGGGVFADQVRAAQKQCGFDDQIAHEMALLAMQQMALMLKSINEVLIVAENILAIQHAWLKHSVVIWSPNIKQFNATTIQASWDVSSDSLAAWLASQLNADELILVKSAEISLGLDIEAMQKQGVLDNAFNEYVNDENYKVTVINKHRLNEFI